MNNDIIKILNLEDYNIDNDSIIITKQKSGFYCELMTKPSEGYCPICGSSSYKIHSYRTKTILHSIYNKYPLYLVCKYRRFICKDCNKVFKEACIVTSKESISFETKMSIIDDLRDFHQTFKSVADKYFISTTKVVNIFDQSYNFTRHSFTKIMCCDEFYRGKKSKQKYAFVILDFDSSKIIDVVGSRKKERLFSYFKNIPLAERNRVEYLSIDMYDTYKDTFSIFFKNTKIAVDSFHVIKHINQALDKLRVFIMNKYDKKSNSPLRNDMYYYMLKKFHYFFIKEYDNIYKGLIKIPKIRAEWYKDEILNYLLSIDETLTSAYKLKEAYRDFNRDADISNKNTEHELDNLIHQFLTFPFEPMREVGKMMRRWKKEILNSFTYINGRRLSNGPIEGANSRIKTIMKNACGYTNFKRFRNRIAFSLNKNEKIKI